MRHQLSTDLVEGSPPVLHVRGEIDLSSAEQLRDALDRARAQEPAFVVDMSGVTFIDATGLHVLVGAAQSRNGRGPLTLVNAPHVVRWLLDLVGLSEEASIELRERSDGHGG